MNKDIDVDMTGTLVDTIPATPNKGNYKFAYWCDTANGTGSFQNTSDQIQYSQFFDSIPIPNILYAIYLTVLTPP